MASRLASAPGVEPLAIDHIGSTAVPGLPAKDVIDAQFIVATLDARNQIIAGFAAIGFRQRPGDWNLRDHVPRTWKGDPSAWDKLVVGPSEQLTSEARTGEGMASCASDLPLNVGVYGAGDSQGTFVLGPVTSDAESVEITSGGEQVEATLAKAPEALQTDIKFYFAQLPEGMPGAPLTVKALDAQHHLLATMAVPARKRAP